MALESRMAAADRLHASLTFPHGDYVVPSHVLNQQRPLHLKWQHTLPRPSRSEGHDGTESGSPSLLASLR
jgi:hypothetical protein